MHIRRKTNAETEALIRAANVILTNTGVWLSRCKISRLVRTYEAQVERNGFAFFEFLENAVKLDAQRRAEALRHPDIARVIAYADPTGETAVRNVMEGR